jgi:nucleotide-binding universal stress UspA family protein
MFQNLLVPLDGTPQSATALIPARTLARALGGRIRLLRVIEAAPSSELADVARSELERRAAELRADDMEVETIVRSGEPALEILRSVRDHSVDLVLMATHGRSGLDRLFLGSVAVSVLAHCPVPILLLRPGGHRLTQLHHMLVPLDGTPRGAVALATAVALVRAAPASLTLLQVVEPTPASAYAVVGMAPGANIDPAWEEDALAAAQTYLDALVARLEQAGVQAHACARVGPIAGTIASEADETGSDLVLMSTAARTGPARALLGSVADEVVRMADRPVLLVRQESPAETTAL